MKLKKGDHVVYKCTNPATGWVVRVARDNKWADVEWNSDRNQRYVQRTAMVLTKEERQ